MQLESRRNRFTQAPKCIVALLKNGLPKIFNRLNSQRFGHRVGNCDEEATSPLQVHGRRRGRDLNVPVTPGYVERNSWLETGLLPDGFRDKEPT
jgi:hypothetical protein